MTTSPLSATTLQQTSSDPTRPSFPTLRFKYPWRPEQKRVLEQLNSYTDDQRIHIVAAPGAGKTVIGLEIFKRLKLKALAISPTMVVRDQWLERLSDFLPADQDYQHWCSHNLHQPALFTTTTYQGLYSFDKRLAKIDSGLQDRCLKTWIKRHNIKLLILDEAHHLKAAWWNVLMKLVEDSNDLMIVSLTATPPYDANVTEWSRYIALCGAVDEEISIPELVRSRSLCPHQDYIWMVKTDDRQVDSLHRQQERLQQFLSDLTQHHELLYLLQLHAWLDPDHPADTKAVLYHLDECFALLSLLKQQQQPLPQYLLSILEKTTADIQFPDVFDWEVLLQSFIDGKHYPNATPVQAFRETFSTLLRGKHFLKNRRVSLDNSQRKLQAFNKTQERIKGCFDIAEVEYANRQVWMRLVVLADYIRDEKYQLALDGLEAPTGCYPIFHYFIHHLKPELAAATALLTGRLSIIHRDHLNALSQHLPQGVDASFSDYSEHADYVVLTMPSQYLSCAFTALHKAGALQILIGTRALLGEGWDAPHVNALILATQTGAYVTTNQLRGRAIRIDPADDFKTASIWHIIAVAPERSQNDFIFQDLNRRFKTFAGIHASELQIESGIERLVFAESDYTAAEHNADGTEGSSPAKKADQADPFIERSNQLMIQRLEDDVFNLQARWQNALENVDQHRFQLGLQTNLSSSCQWHQLTYAFTNKRHSLGSVLRSPLGMLSSTAGFLGAASAAISVGAIPLITAMTGAAGMGVSLLATKVAKDFSWNRRFANTPETSVRDSGITLEQSGLEAHKTIRAFAQITLNALRDAGQIQTPPADSAADELTVTELKPGYFRFSLIGFTRQENDTFLTGLSQLLEPIRHPRYVLVLAKQPKPHQIVPVPNILGNNKKNASTFAKRWNQQWPEKKPASLHWTASPEGQRYLLKAKVAAHGTTDDLTINLIDRWE